MTRAELRKGYQRSKSQVHTEGDKEASVLNKLNILAALRCQ